MINFYNNLTCCLLRILCGPDLALVAAETRDEGELKLSMGIGMVGYQKIRTLFALLGILVALPASAATFSHMVHSHSAMAESSSTASSSDVVYLRFDHSNKIQAPSELPSQFGLKVREFLLRITRDESTAISLRDLSSQKRILRTQDAVIGEMIGKKHTSQGFEPVKAKVTGHSSRVLGQSISEKVEVLTSFQRGLQFDMNLKTLFSDDGTSSSPTSPELRYGLVLKDIEPSSDSVRQAAIGEFRPEDLAYAGQAKVVWGIEPIMRRPNQPMFAVSRPTTDYMDPSKADTRGLFGTISLPEPDFTGRITPKSSAEGLKDGIPPLQITLEQKQGYYWTEIHSKANFKKDLIKHGMRIPFYRAAHVQQIFKEDFDSERTSICNLLGDAHKPTVNINYIHADDRYSGDLYMVRKRWTVGFTAEAAPRSNPIADFGKGHGEKYEVKIGTDF